MDARQWRGDRPLTTEGRPRPPRRRRRQGAKPGAPRGRGPRLETEHQHSAGGLVVHGRRILLISTREGRRWQLPKGHLEEGETSEQAALREVREETGINGRMVAPLPGIEYWFVEQRTRRIHKRVDYYLLDYESGDISDFDPEEVTSAEWFSWEDGIARLSFENERRVALEAWKLSGDAAEATPTPIPSPAPLPAKLPPPPSLSPGEAPGPEELPGEAGEKAPARKRRRRGRRRGRRGRGDAAAPAPSGPETDPSQGGEV